MLRIARIKSFVGVYRLLGFLAVLIAVVATIFVLVTNNSAPASALTTVPTRMNFQGRLADSTGNIKQNGTYNMRLRLYTAASGGTAVWTEDRLVSAGNGITLTNGLFALQLGSVTALPASLFASGPLYLEVELPTPATATSSSPSWTEGAMTPRNQMATSAYAYNAELLDGQDGDYYLNASNLNAGTVNSARITGAYANMTGTGALVSGSIASGFGTIATGNTIQGSRFISTVATGTAPLTVTSTTKVTNLNVDLLDGLDSTAFYRESLGSVAADFNNYTASGAYHVNAWSAGGVLNGPVGSYDWGMLDVQRFNGATYVSQTYRPHNTDIAWTRVLWAGTWTAWREAWGSANDGAGSGLDADLLDGLSSASFIQNTTTPQTANFNVSGNGTIGGALTVSGDGTVAGSLGVGTTNPGSKLQIGNSVQMNVYISEGSVTGNRWYYLGQANANNGTVLVDGVLGGHNSRGGNVSLAFTQRDGFSVTGSAYGGSGFAQGNIQVYRDASNNIKVYLKTASWALTNLTSRASSGATVTYDGTFTTTAPTDTLVFDLATDDSPGLIKIDNTGTGKIGSNNIMTSANSVLLQASSPGAAQTGNINITGTIIAGGFSGSGSGLTNLSATNLSSGTIASARITGSYTGITGLGTLTSLAVSGNATVGSLSINGGNIHLSDAGLQGDGYGISSTSDLLLSAANGIDVSSELRANSGFKVYSGPRVVLDADATTSTVTLGQTSTTDTFTKLANPASLPTGTGNRVAYSPDGRYMSVAHFTSPFVTIYKRSGDTFTKLANPATLPTGSGYGTDFSPDGQYMTVAHSTSPYITIYKRSGDTFTKLANPASLPSGIGINVSFSPDGVYMSVGLNTAPYLIVYKRSGDTFTKLADPTTPGSAGNDVNFSSDGQYLTVASQSSPYVHIYKRSGDTFTKLANPATLPTGSSYESTFSPDGQYMSVAHATSPYVTIYKRAGNTFTKLADPGVLPTATTRAVDFSPDGNYLSVGVDGGLPRIVVYKRSGDTFTKLSDVATEPAGGVVSAEFSPNGQYLSVSHNNSPYVTIYRVGSGNSVDITLNGAISSTGAIQGSKLDITGFTNLQGGANVQGLLNVQGTSTFVQTEGDSPGLRVQGRTGTQLFDVNVFEVVDSNGNVMLGANQGAGRRVSIIGGSGFWNTAALEVYTAESGGRGISIKGSSGQTADYMRVIDSSNNQLFSVSANGSVVSAAGLQGATLSLSGSATVSGSVTAGSMYSSGWFYSTGATGWYNSTYGGGMHMADSTWIRTYGSKTLYVESGLDTGGASGVGCGGGLGGGYTFRVCGSGNMTGGLTTASLTSSGGTTLAGDFWWGGSQSGIQGTVCVGVGNNVFRNNGGCSSSSIRFKENVTTLDDSALSLLGQLRPVSFDWKGDYDMTAADGGKHDFGVIAEEVQAVLPNLVTYDPEGRVNGVKYEGFIPFLIKAVQEQQSQIVQLQGGNPSFTSLTVNGPATVQSLTVRGDAHVKGDIYVEGHLVSRGSTPTVDTSLLSCVDGILVTGTDIAGAIQFEVDEASCTSADLRFVFAKEYSLAPNATLTAKDRGSARLDSSLDASTDKMTFSFDGLQTGKTYRFTYHVIQ